MLVLAACSGGESDTVERVSTMDIEAADAASYEMAAPPPPPAMASQAAEGEASDTISGGGEIPVGTPQVAYRYAYGFRLGFPFVSSASVSVLVSSLVSFYFVMFLSVLVWIWLPFVLVSGSFVSVPSPLFSAFLFSVYFGLVPFWFGSGFGLGSGSGSGFGLVWFGLARFMIGKKITRALRFRCVCVCV